MPPEQRSQNVISACTPTDRSRFLRAWFRSPLQVASVTPSSRSLARLMTCEIDLTARRIIELGAGTGVFTRALLERGVHEGSLTLIEQDEGFAEMLKQRYPLARTHNIDASRIASHFMCEEKFDAAVSGLPLLAMPPRTVMTILAATFRLIREQGRFYQFTYGPRCPIPRIILDRLGLRAVRIGWTIQNLPPAAVYRISKRRPLK